MRPETYVLTVNLTRDSMSNYQQTKFEQQTATKFHVARLEAESKSIRHKKFSQISSLSRNLFEIFSEAKCDLSESLNCCEPLDSEHPDTVRSSRSRRGNFFPFALIDGLTSHFLASSSFCYSILTNLLSYH